MPWSPWRLNEHPLPELTASSSLSVLQLTYLPPPWGECRSSEMGLDFFPVYSITACRIDCETRYIVENCNCRMVHMPGGCQSPQETHHPLQRDCSREAGVPDHQGVDGNSPPNNQGSILVCRSTQMCASPPFRHPICLPVVCCSCLPSSASR